MGEPVYYPVVKAFLGIFKLWRINVDCVGAEHVPTSGGAVFAINHTSFLDFIFAGVPAEEHHRYVRFMAKDAVFAHRIAGPLMRGMKHIPVDRSAGAHAYDTAVEALRAGEIVGVFPEATMSRSFDVKDFKTGAVRMAAEAGVPLYPEIVFGGQRMYSYHHRDFSRGHDVAITLGEPMHPTTADDPEELTAQLRARMITMLDETIARYPMPLEADADLWWLPARHGGTAPTLEQAAVLEEEARARKAAKRAEN
ncbi:MAG: 1-acyl-sn-glycerol-3-phosphate acyltransferase [Actinobacteria bacterium]|nr:1-acyl-sn-glycerol-3-phosphate acyltransferase [Actinomycetota bacterium]